MCVVVRILAFLRWLCGAVLTTILGPTFYEFSEFVLSTKEVKARNTYSNASLHIKRLGNYYGNLRLRKFNEFHWTKYIVDQRKEHPTKRFFDDRKYLNVILLSAYKNDVIKKRIFLEKPDIPRDVGREILPDELSRLLLAAGEDLKLQIMIAYKMGLRLREMLSLKWEQLNLRSQLCYIPAERVKTRKARYVPITNDLTELLKARFDAIGGVYVFPGKAKKWCYSNKSAWHTCKRKAQVECRWHDLRHTCATVMLRRGVFEADVLKILGMSLGVLRRIYRHVQAPELKALVKVMEGGI